MSSSDQTKTPAPSMQPGSLIQMYLKSRLSKAMAAREEIEQADAASARPVLGLGFGGNARPLTSPPNQTDPFRSYTLPDYLDLPPPQRTPSINYDALERLDALDRERANNVAAQPAVSTDPEPKKRAADLEVIEISDDEDDTGIIEISDDDAEVALSAVTLTSLSRPFGQGQALMRAEPIENCGICLSAMDDSRKMCTLSNCKHRFHTACIGAWVRINGVCPYCRTDIRWLMYMRKKHRLNKESKKRDPEQDEVVYALYAPLPSDSEDDVSEYDPDEETEDELIEYEDELIEEDESDEE